MTLIASIGPKGLYLLFLWLISSAAAAWVADRKGYGERVGLTFGLVLTVVGLLIVLLLPSRPGSKWRVEGWLPRRGSAGPAVTERSASPPPLAPPPSQD
jgi:hypothetical protein